VRGVLGVLGVLGVRGVLEVLAARPPKRATRKAISRTIGRPKTTTSRQAAQVNPWCTALSMPKSVSGCRSRPKSSGQCVVKSCPTPEPIARGLKHSRSTTC